MDIEDIISDRNTPELLAWRALMCIMILDEKSRKSNDWFVSWDQMRNEILGGKHPLIDNGFIHSSYDTFGRHQVPKVNETRLHIGLFLPEQDAEVVMKRITACLAAVLHEAGLTEFAGERERDQHNLCIHPLDGEYELSSTSRSESGFSGNSIHICFGLDLYINEKDWQKVAKRLQHTYRQLKDAAKAASPEEIEADLVRKMAEKKAAKAVTEPAPAKAEDDPRRKKLTEELEKIGIDEGHAGAIYEILLTQEQQLAKGSKGNSLTLSGSEGLMAVVQKASGLSKKAFYINSGKLANSSAQKIKNEGDYIPKTAVLAKMLGNLNMGCFAGCFLQTVGIDTRTPDEIIKEEAAKDDPNFASVASRLRNAGCLVGEKATTWQQAIESGEETSILAVADFARLSGISKSAAGRIETGAQPSDSDLGKFKSFYGISGAAEQTLDTIVARNFARKHDPVSLKSITEKVEREHDRKSFGHLLLELCAGFVRTDAGFIPAFKAPADKKSEPVTLVMVGEVLGVSGDTVQAWASRSVKLLPGGPNLKKLARLFADLPFDETGRKATEEELSAVLTEYKLATKAWHEAGRPSPGSVAKDVDASAPSQPKSKGK